MRYNVPIILEKMAKFWKKWQNHLSGLAKIAKKN